MASAFLPALATPTTHAHTMATSPTLMRDDRLMTMARPSAASEASAGVTRLPSSREEVLLDLAERGARQGVDQHEARGP